jgi:hypothetical protein
VVGAEVVGTTVVAAVTSRVAAGSVVAAVTSRVAAGSVVAAVMDIEAIVVVASCGVGRILHQFVIN